MPGKPKIKKKRKTRGRKGRPAAQLLVGWWSLVGWKTESEVLVDVFPVSSSLGLDGAGRESVRFEFEGACAQTHTHTRDTLKNLKLK